MDDSSAASWGVDSVTNALARPAGVARIAASNSCVRRLETTDHLPESGFHNWAGELARNAGCGTRAIRASVNCVMPPRSEVNNGRAEAPWCFLCANMALPRLP